MKNDKRVFLIVLDSAGVGELPDAAAYGDAGSNTFRAITKSKKLKIPNLTSLGLYDIPHARLRHKDRVPQRRVRLRRGMFRRQGYHRGPLGDSGDTYKTRFPGISRRFPRRRGEKL